MGNISNRKENYKRILSSYMKKHDEQSLYLGQQLIRTMIEQGITPEEVVKLHVDALMELCDFVDNEIKSSFDFLLEMMLDFGFAYREHQSLRNRQQQLDAEIEIAASMQQTLLIGDVPKIDSLDIGVISQPSKKMNGDYYHFVQDEKDRVSIAVADIIGKGIPAALCMSMIKYAMDSLPDQRTKPGAMLGNLNRVVEQNVDDSMFITMFYGLYDPAIHRFFYASAGHEPGFLYQKKTETFHELMTKGIVLGVAKDANYPEYELNVERGDMVVLLSDGVTECRSENGFIQREAVTALIRKYEHLPAQQIVEEVFFELEKLQNFELRDDFTLIIFRRNV